MYIESYVSWYAYQIRMANLKFEYKPCLQGDCFNQILLWGLSFPTSKRPQWALATYSLDEFRRTRKYILQISSGWDFCCHFSRVNHGYWVILGVSTCGFQVFPGVSSHRFFQVFPVVLCLFGGSFSQWFSTSKCSGGRMFKRALRIEIVESTCEFNLKSGALYES